MKHTIDWEARFADALTRIARHYMTPEQIRRDAARQGVFSADEALGMAYDNLQAEAQGALHGYRRKKVKTVKLAPERP